MKEEQEQRSPQQRLADTGNVLYMLASAHEACLSPFMRINFGIEAPGVAGTFGFILILVYGLLMNSRAMLAFLVCWVVLVAKHRIKARLTAQRGEHVHSRYAGWPWLAMKVPFVRQQLSAKMFIEPVICFLVGAMICPFSVPLGAFVMGGMFSIRIKAGVENELMRLRTQRMRDAWIEQKELNDRFEDSL